MIGEQKQEKWLFLFWWTVLTVVGSLIGGYITDAVGLGTQKYDTASGILLSMLSSGIFALFVCAAQWILLRRYIPKSGLWMVAGIVGRSLGVLVGLILVLMATTLFNIQGGNWTYPALIFIRGAALGFSQWILLKKYFPRTGWWILGNAIGWMLVPMIAGYLVPTMLGSLVISLIVYTLAGVITGTLMVWILNQPILKPKGQTGTSSLIRSFAIVWALSWGVSWLAGWYIVMAIGWGISFTVGGEVGGMLAGGIAGLIGGVGTAIILKKAKVSKGLRIYHLILLAFGLAGIVIYDWSDGFVVASMLGDEIRNGIGGPLIGIAGGALTALILSWADHSINVKKLLMTVGGWILGFGLGGMVAWKTGYEIALGYVYSGNNSGDISNLILLILISSVCGAFAGWLSGTATSYGVSDNPTPR